MAGYVLYFLSRKKELISRSVVARRSARSIFFFALQTRRAFRTFRSTVGVRLRLENYKNPLES